VNNVNNAVIKGYFFDILISIILDMCHKGIVASNRNTILGPSIPFPVMDILIYISTESVQAF
jgi:hypothetical protein